MHTQPMYGKVLSESPTEVVIQDGKTMYKLHRCRMYNSHIDTRGYLLTTYADKEYKAAVKLGGKQRQLREKRVSKPSGL